MCDDFSVLMQVNQSRHSLIVDITLRAIRRRVNPHSLSSALLLAATSVCTTRLKTCPHPGNITWPSLDLAHGATQHKSRHFALLLRAYAKAMAFPLSHTLAPTSGTFSSKTSGTLLLSLLSKENGSHFSSKNNYFS